MRGQAGITTIHSVPPVLLRLEHAVGDAKMSFAREASVGCGQFISGRLTKSRTAGWKLPLGGS